MVEFNVVIEKDEDGMLVSKVPDLPGCHTQAKNLPELLKRTKEAISLCLEVNKLNKEYISNNEFVGIQQIEIVV